MPDNAPQSAEKSGCSNCILRGVGVCNFLIDQGHDRARPGPRSPVPQTTKQASRGRVIIRQDDDVDSIPVICDGWVSIVARSSHGRRQILSFVLPGEFVSYALLFDQRHRHSTIALTNTCARFFSRPGLRDVLLSTRDAFERLASAIIDERKRIDQLITDLGQRSANGRIARLILSFWERLAARGLVHNHTFAFPLRQSDIADATGLTVAHVNRVFNQLRARRTIELTDRSLTILDLRDLQLLSEQ